MRCLFRSQELRNLVLISYMEMANEREFNALPHMRKDAMHEHRKNDTKTLYFIFQSQNNPIFKRFKVAKMTKEAWDQLEKTYREK